MFYGFIAKALRQQKTSSPKFAARLNAFKIGANDYWPGKNKITTSYS
jgi:hypothetical protein